MQQPCREGAKPICNPPPIKFSEYRYEDCYAQRSGSTVKSVSNQLPMHDLRNRNGICDCACTFPGIGMIEFRRAAGVIASARARRGALGKEQRLSVRVQWRSVPPPCEPSKEKDDPNNGNRYDGYACGSDRNHRQIPRQTGLIYWHCESPCSTRPQMQENPRPNRLRRIDPDRVGIAIDLVSL